MYILALERYERCLNRCTIFDEYPNFAMKLGLEFVTWTGCMWSHPVSRLVVLAAKPGHQGSDMVPGSPWGHRVG